MRRRFVKGDRISLTHDDGTAQDVVVSAGSHGWIELHSVVKQDELTGQWHGAVVGLSPRGRWWLVREWTPLTALEAERMQDGDEQC